MAASLHCASTGLLNREGQFSIPEVGATFSPYELTIERGEDVLGRISSLAARAGPDQGICIVMATGFVSGFMATEFFSGITHKRVHDVDVSYQGTFAMLHLHGLYLPMEKGGAIRSRIKITASSCDGLRHVIGGVVTGKLIANSPVRVTIGSFKVDFDKLQAAAAGGKHVLDAVPRPIGIGSHLVYLASHHLTKVDPDTLTREWRFLLRSPHYTPPWPCHNSYLDILYGQQPPYYKAHALNGQAPPQDYHAVYGQAPPYYKAHALYGQTPPHYNPQDYLHAVYGPTPPYYKAQNSDLQSLCSRFRSLL